jgi:hypothetical protein
LGFFSTRSIVVDFTSLGGFPATAEFIRYITYNDTQVLFNKIDLNDEYNFDNSLPVSLGGTGSTTASAARSALGVDPAGTDNSTDVTLTSVASNYLTISGQAITAGTVPVALGGTGSTTASAARTALGVDPSGTDNSTNVTLATVSSNYLTISGQEITAGTVPFQLGGTGLTSLGSANQVLAVNSGGTALEFQNQSGGGLTDIVTDTTPQLGGSLDVNGQSIVSVSAGNIAITPDTTGKIILDGLSWPTADGSANQVLKTDGSGNLGFVDQSGSGGITAGKAIALAMIFG